MNAPVTSAIKGVVERNVDTIIHHIKRALPRKSKSPLLLRGYFNVGALRPACGVVDVGNSRYAHIKQAVQLYLVNVTALCNVAGVIKKVRR